LTKAPKKDTTDMTMTMISVVLKGKFVKDKGADQEKAGVVLDCEKAGRRTVGERDEERGGGRESLQ
jgi:hypothetical protein